MWCQIPPMWECMLPLRCHRSLTSHRVIPMAGHLEIFWVEEGDIPLTSEKGHKVQFAKADERSLTSSIPKGAWNHLRRYPSSNTTCKGSTISSSYWKTIRDVLVKPQNLLPQSPIQGRNWRSVNSKESYSSDMSPFFQFQLKDIRTQIEDHQLTQKKYLYWWKTSLLIMPEGKYSFTLALGRTTNGILKVSFNISPMLVNQRKLTCSWWLIFQSDPKGKANLRFLSGLHTSSSHRLITRKPITSWNTSMP